MNQVQSISAAAKQKQTVLFDDGTQMELLIEYKPLQLGWYITSLTYGNFEITGLRIVTSPNMLHQYLGQIQFGLACETTDNQEPTLQEDFLQGRASLYVLTLAEATQYKEYLSGKTVS
jgi:hypothetical protein